MSTSKCNYLHSPVWSFHCMLHFHSVGFVSCGFNMQFTSFLREFVVLIFFRLKKFSNSEMTPQTTICKHTHLFDKKNTPKKTSKQKLIFRSCSCVFLCKTKFVWGFAGIAFFIACMIFVHTAPRNEMHTVCKLDILFISESLKYSLAFSSLAEHSLKQMELLYTPLKQDGCRIPAGTTCLIFSLTHTSFSFPNHLGKPLPFLARPPRYSHWGSLLSYFCPFTPVSLSFFFVPLLPIVSWNRGA